MKAFTISEALDATTKVVVFILYCTLLGFYMCIASVAVLFLFGGAYVMHELREFLGFDKGWLR